MPLSTVPPHEITAAVLAGGRGLRLGGVDKGALSIGGQAILDRQFPLLQRVARHFLIVANELDRYAPPGVRVVRDRVPGGALAGLYTALASAPSPWTLVVACDLPFLSPSVLDRLVASPREADAVVPRTAGGWQPLCALYASRCAGPLGRRLAAGALRIVDALADLDVQEIGPEELAVLDPEGRAFFNVNTRAALARARAWAMADS